jgi:hypothetical protein
MKFLFFIFFSTQIFAVSQVNPNMMAVAQTLKELFPYLVSSEKFNNKSQEKNIGEKITALNTLFKENQVHFRNAKVTRILNHELMLDVLNQADKNFKLGRKDYARQILKSTPGICLSCHTQDHIQNRFFPSPSLSDFTNLKDAAEFSLITRDYSKAKKYLKEYIEGKNKLSHEQILSGMRLSLATSLHDKTSYQDIFSQLNDWKKLFKTDIYNKNLNEWETGVKSLEKSTPPEMNFNSIKKWMNKTLAIKDNSYGVLANNTEEIIYFKLKDYFYELLQTDISKKEIPEVLFYLALAEKALNYDFFFSLADAYLRACIKEFPKDPMAKKCFNEYKGFIEFSYTGSAGTDVPKDVTQELNSLEKLLK